MTSIEEKYIQLHPKSKMLFEEAKDLFPDGVTHDARRMNPFPIYITRAEGCKNGMKMEINILIILVDMELICLVIVTQK